MMIMYKLYFTDGSVAFTHIWNYEDLNNSLKSN
jgi:hypothetical protein